jgi:hypothetical protein
VADIITIDDLPADVRSAELVVAMLAGANAKASRVAPCLVHEESGSEATEDQLAEARLVLIGAIVRWSQAGSGALQSQTAGPFGVTLDTRQRAGFNLWPSEIEALQAICRNATSSGAFSVDTAPSLGGAHLPWCSLSLGAAYCSCGADIAGEPIYELG